jgi:tRNA nucleotidyltransferase/poly(A) polymerase
MIFKTINPHCNEGNGKKLKNVLAVMMKEDIKYNDFTHNALMDEYCLHLTLFEINKAKRQKGRVTPNVV